MRRSATIISAVAMFAGLAAPTPPSRDAGAIDAPDVIELAPRAYLYPLAGNYTRGGKPVAAPAREVRPARPLWIMRREVSAAEYRRCVAAGGCAAVPGLAERGERPALGVSWRDASAYAAWLTRRFGATYRLPTDEEWAFAAGSRFKPLPLPASGNDPAAIVLAAYEREAALAAEADARPGANENGLVDVAGTVAEWTDTCYRHVELNAAGARPIVDCGLRVVEGRHRTYMPQFIRDPRAGGCSIGTPLSHLGFRLVREDSAVGWWDRFVGVAISSSLPRSALWFRR